VETKHYFVGCLLTIILASTAAAEVGVAEVSAPKLGPPDVGMAVATDYTPLDCLKGCGRPCRIYGGVDFLLLNRDNRTLNQPVVLDYDSDSAAVVLTTRDFQFDYEAGAKATIGYRLGDRFAVEVVYQSLFDTQSAHTVTGDNNLAIPGDLGLVSYDFFGADIMRLTYASKFHSVEANLVKLRECNACVEDCSGGCTKTRHWWRDWFAGFRYVYLVEQFDIRSTDFQEGTGVYNVRTRNDLLGAQLGTRWGWARGRLGCELTGKAGVFGNTASQRQYVIDSPPEFPLRPATGDNGGRVSFVGEIGAMVRYEFTNHWALRGGYNLMWIEGVALAPDQLDFTNEPDSGSRLVADGGVLFHGANVGIEARW
jgi:hypothetical protein